VLYICRERNENVMAPRIKVFVTKTKEFRARITESKGKAPYEVTIGGESWNKGKGREFEAQIKRKCFILISVLSDKIENSITSDAAEESTTPIVVNKNGITIKELKELVKDLPEQDKNGEDFELWVMNTDGSSMSNVAKSIMQLNRGDLIVEIGS
jgi:hypothetical protein